MAAPPQGHESAGPGLRNRRMRRKLVPPGASKTTSPGCATSEAAATGLRQVVAARDLHRADSASAAMFEQRIVDQPGGLAEPESRIAPARGSSPRTLPGEVLVATPARSTMGSVNDRSAAMVRSGAVAIESLTQVTPVRSRTISSRCSTPAKVVATPAWLRHRPRPRPQTTRRQNIGQVVATAQAAPHPPADFGIAHARSTPDQCITARKAPPASLRPS